MPLTKFRVSSFKFRIPHSAFSSFIVPQSSFDSPFPYILQTSSILHTPQKC